jgi:hypothetical protein
MFQAIKKAWNRTKRWYAEVTTAEEEVKVEIRGTNKNTSSYTDPKYWAEFAEQLKIKHLAEQYNIQQEKLAKRTDEESVRMWRENNAAVNNYFNRKTVSQKRHLRVVSA